MAIRPFLYLDDTVCKCVFTTLQLRPKLRAVKLYKQTRNFRKFKVKENVSETSFQNININKEIASKFPKLLKPFVFTIMFGGTTFVAAAIWEYENIRERTSRIINHYKHFEIRRTGWRHEMEIWWKNLTEGEKIFVPICFLNALVFLAWRLPMLKQTMSQYFCSSIASRTICWPMLLSTFSHSSFLHLAVNMYVLHSFSSMAVAALGKEQFMALYLTSGVVSSFASNLFKTVFGIQKPSLGASGAILGIFGFVCTEFPSTQLSFIFLPMYKFSSSTVIQAIIGLDILGCLLRWPYLDHAAHLGGILFGIFWHSWGNANIWLKREPVLRIWHEIREPHGPH
ncbi:rhomboid family intramembrane serine protease rho-7 [Ptiloglossa arizonensis]|uniref:rhomboid family intramembrane serine protease rho-7 n=1 Tax=Ptiloglossa arizonensis TaxID=3350558 RepID=UPI003F9F6D70